MVLQLSRRGRIEGVCKLPLDQDLALRKAFGRFACHDARPAGASVVREHQHRASGHWFLCDCLGEVPRPPALIPVSESHLRRNTEAHWPAHADWCDFYREPLEQQLVTASFRRPPLRRSLALVTSFKPADTSRPRIGSRSNHQRRSALATLLMTLLEKAGLHRVLPDSPLPRLSAQYGRIRSSARDIDLEAGESLADYLITYPPALPQLVAKLTRMSPERFSRTRRPHGLLIGMADGASAGEIRPLHGDPIPVAGEIAIFGEEDGHHQRSAANARAPYLMACVVGRRSPEMPVEVLRAYLHPCVSRSHLMLVDSSLERRTLAVLSSLQGWLSARKSLAVTIEKPLFDLSPVRDQAPSVVKEPCLPDFILRARSVPAGGQATVIVETMGYATEAYRARKERTHHAMQQVLGGSPLALRDFAADVPDATRDRSLWLTCRWLLTGPESQPTGRSGASSPPLPSSP